MTKRELTPKELEHRKASMKAWQEATRLESRDKKVELATDGQEAFDDLLKKAAQPKK